MKFYKALKTFNGYVSVRSTIVKECIKRKQPLCILFNGKSLTLSPKDLETKKHILNPQVFTSKYSGSYQLWDYKWEPENKQVEFPL